MRRISAFALIGVTGLLSLNASAQNRDAVSAEALFLEGRKAADAGDYSAACPKFAESYRLDPAPGTLLNTADCEERLGHIATAWLNFRKAVELLPPNDSRVPIASRKASSLEKRLPRLTIRLARDVPPGTGVKRDGVEIGPGSLGVALPIDPGKHIVLVTAPGYGEQRYEIELAERQSRELVGQPAREKGYVEVASSPKPAPSDKPNVPRLEPDPKGAAIAPLPDTAPPPVSPAFTTTQPVARPSVAPGEPADESGKTQRVVGWSVVGVGGLGLALGIVEGIVAGAKKSALDNAGCRDGHCFTSQQSDVDAYNGARTLSIVGFIAGGVGIASGAALVFSAPHAKRETAGYVHPFVGPGWAGVAGRF
jgi:hypothetical protein